MVERIEHYGAAVPTTLSSPLSSAGVTFDIADATGWPTGAIGKFYVTIDAGQTSEERILCASRSGNTVTVATSGRGVDGTSASAHAASAPVAHTYSATEADDSNTHQLATSAVHGVAGALVGTTDTQTLTNKTLSGSANTFSNIPESAVTNLSSDLSTLTSGVNAKVPLSTVTTKGDLIVATASGAVARVGVGTNGQVLTADSAQAGGVKWATPSSAAGLVKIATQTLGATTASVTFSSIPQTYSGLRMVYVARTDGTGSQRVLYLQFNGDSGAHYNSAGIYGNGSTPTNVGDFGVSVMDVGLISAASAPAGCAGVGEIIIPAYAATTYYKSVSATTTAQPSSGSQFSGTFGGTWTSTAAITSVTLTSSGGSLLAGSTFTLYGVV